LIKEITIKRRKDFPKPEYAYDLLRLFGENIVTAIDDGLWKKHRSLCYPAFSDDNNALVAERTAVNLHRLFKIWETSSDATEEKGKKVWHVDLDNEMVKLALSVIGEAGFGMDLGDPVTADNSKLGESRAAEERQLLDGHKLTVQDALQKVCKNLTLKLILPRFALHLPFERMQEIRICFDEFQRYMKDLIAEKRKLQEAKAKDTTEEVKNVKKKADLLTILTEHATGMTNDEIFGDIFIFLVAGKLFYIIFCFISSLNSRA
jgi:cytochrome P450